MNQSLGMSLWLLGAGGLTALGLLLNRAARRKASRELSAATPTGLQQGCAIPYRIEGGEVEVCLISLSNQSGWGFPKGLVDPPEDIPTAALRESFEEAGVRGSIVGQALGEYSYRKRGVQLHVTAYLMRVTAVEEHWPEKRVRQRQFMPPTKARALVATSEQRQLLDVAMARLADLPEASGR